MISNGQNVSVSMANGNSFASQESTERECPLWQWVVRVTGDRD